ncbi:hypothetical protein ACFQFC_38605 [Amorphoplanes digitatis]|uniref:Uncharacterized protein n=1 Tax=Actinoplanes digitatis TaxID=1868 RepID=A0A7W7HWM2_9ACTN|nr:hypothetical protein [Actinoplanes digitatis]MBB4762078.1 hypothetical protein [Actinoplanes digitatis]BFE70822.1 hypothetical protein GCM10020092_041230 [Actinoplanes digitatis]GID97049.1 hypothetical protein Adi01nite_64610 [Actinoplanes digitatis]
MTYGKKDLPFPYDQDFSGIVTRVKGVREATRVALINSPKVASYLKAGANLIEQHFGGDEPAAAAAAAESGRKPYWSGIRFLSERALSREMENLEPPFLRQKGDGPYRSTWACHDDYLNDLLAFIFHDMNYDPQYNAEIETRGSWVSTDASFVDVVDRATYHELQTICRMPLFRLQLLMVATAHRNDGIHDAISSNYEGALDPWKKIYESTIAARGFQLREGITLDQFTNMLAAITEGFAIRNLGDPSAGVLGDGPPDNLAGMAVLAILNSYLEPVGTTSGTTLRESFGDISDRARPTDGTDDGTDDDCGGPT